MDCIGIALELYLALNFWHLAQHAREQGALARSNSADHSDEGAFLHVQVDVAQ